MFNLGQFEKLGRNEDDTIAHVATGEMVIRPELLGGALTNQIKSKMEGMGFDPAKYTVGSSANSINPNTMQPEFGFFGDLFGTSGTNKGFNQMVDKFDPEIQNLKYSQKGITSPFGNVSYDENGVNVTPSAEAQATSSMFAGLAPDFLDRLTQNTEGQELRDFYQQNAPTRSREELEQLYLGGIDNTDIDRSTDSRLSQLFGGSGLTTGSASAMGEFNRQANLEKQQRRISAYDAVNRDKYNEFTNFQNMLAGTQAFRGANLDNLMNASRAQYSPFSALAGLLQPSMGYNESINQFGMDKLGARMGLAGDRASAMAQPRSGWWQNVVNPTLDAVFPG